MSDKAKEQHNNILLAVVGFSAVVLIVALIGFLALDRDPEIIQGEMEVEEYRVSSKVPGRILELRVKEGDFVKAGEAIAIIGESGTLTTGPHLHFELWHNGVCVNPQEYITFEKRPDETD